MLFAVFLIPLSDLDILERVEVEYVTLPGWKSSIDRSKKYADFIEESLKVPANLKRIGVGQGR